jgi:hypothetical protein
MIRLKGLMLEQGTTVKANNPYKRKLAKKLANDIYNAKGVFQDAEYKASVAVSKITDLETFNYTQKELQALTGGRGIGQYLKSFIDVGFFKWTDESPGSGPNRLQKTQRLIDNIVTHLTKIGAPAATIQILTNYKTEMVDRVKEDRHNLMALAQVASLLIPVAGPIVSGAIGAADSAMYFKEDNPYMGGMMAVFALTPGIGALVGKTGLPKFIANLAAKASSKAPILTNLERKVLITTAMSKDAIEARAAKIVANGIKSGTLNPHAVKSLSWVKPAGKGLYNIALGGVKYAVVPAVAYDYAFRSDPIQKLVQPDKEELRRRGQLDLDAELKRYSNKQGYYD